MKSKDWETIIPRKVRESTRKSCLIRILSLILNQAKDVVSGCICAFVTYSCFSLDNSFAKTFISHCRKLNFSLPDSWNIRQLDNHYSGSWIIRQRTKIQYCWCNFLIEAKKDLIIIKNRNESIFDTFLVKSRWANENRWANERS